MTSTITDYQPMITSLMAKMSHLTSVIATETNTRRYIKDSRSLEWVFASLGMVKAQNALVTATEEAVQASATQAIASASSSFLALSRAENLYGMTPSYGGNVAMAVLMGLLFGSHSVLGYMYHTWWFVVSYFMGTVLEMTGYISRSLSAHDTSNSNAFLAQIVCLTIAPCFIMAGIYFLLAQLIMIYGTNFALMRPMTYSYLFISCDVLSLLVQGAGGGIASHAVTMYESSADGTHVMVAGLAFQVLSMSAFIILFGHFCWRIKYLRSGYDEMEPQFNPAYSHIRSNKLFRFFPLVIMVSVILIYIRSVYRVAELSEGWRGYLITHETYFLLLDALMIAAACAIFLPFHPGVVVGQGSIPVEGTKAYTRMKEKRSDLEYNSTDDSSNEMKEVLSTAAVSVSESGG